MKAPKEIRQRINRLRRRWADRKNGVICIGIMDSPEMERKLKNSKRNYRRCAQS